MDEMEFTEAESKSKCKVLSTSLELILELILSPASGNMLDLVAECELFLFVLYFSFHFG